MATTHTAGRVYLVTRSEREAFLGRAIDEPFDGRLALEGKGLVLVPGEPPAVRPFTTRLDLPATGAGAPERIEDQDALEEAERLLARSVGCVHRTSFPLLSRWLEAGREPCDAPAAATAPFRAFLEAFHAGAERFRRALYHSPQVTATRELDRLTELEGDLVIELGKTANDLAVRLGALVNAAPELARYLDRLGAPATPGATGAGGADGFDLVVARLDAATHFGRERDEAHLVREVNALAREGLARANDVLLEHAGALDTLVTETIGRYGIACDVWGPLSPFTTAARPRGTTAAVAGAL